MNVKKTEYMTFFDGDVNVHLQGERIRKTDTYKLVGIVIDKELSWNPHFEKVVTKLRQATGMLARSKHILPAASKLLIYHSLFRSYLTYGLAHYGAINKTKVNTLQNLQDRALRCVFHVRNRFLPEIRKEHKLLTVQDEIILSRVQLGVSVTNEQAPNNVRSIFQSNVPSRRTRQAEAVKLVLPKWKLEMWRKQSSYAVPLVFNQLHKSVLELKPKAISKHVKQLLLKSYKNEK